MAKKTEIEIKRPDATTSDILNIERLEEEDVADMIAEDTGFQPVATFKELEEQELARRKIDAAHLIGGHVTAILIHTNPNKGEVYGLEITVDAPQRDKVVYQAWASEDKKSHEIKHFKIEEIA